MTLPLQPPLKPMLGRLARELPVDGYLYEPKWDGFRCLAFRDGDDVDLRSRHGKPLARYFPDLVEALRAVEASAFVLDGEIVVVSERGFDFPALMARLHPAASRVARLRHETPAAFVAFDLLASGEDDLRERAFSERRERLAALLGVVSPPLHLTPITTEPAVAHGWLDRLNGAGCDGVMAKQRGLRYQPGARAMVKVKRERTADCVVAGFRVFAGEPLVASLLLGLYGEAELLEHVGVVSSFSNATRRSLLDELRPLVVPLTGHPWESGFLLAGGPTGRLKGAAGSWTPEMERDWIPLEPSRVCEVAYDQLDGYRFRHPARFKRWRPDREPRSCAVAQLAMPAESAPAHLLNTS